MDDALYFTTGQGTVKGENLAHNAHCVLTLAATGTLYRNRGRGCKGERGRETSPGGRGVRGPGLARVCARRCAGIRLSARPLQGPAPYDVYEITPTVAFAFGTEEATVYNTTRYRF